MKILNLSRKMVEVCEDIDGREATTIFERIKYSSSLNVSLVRCKPETGRYHQVWMFDF